MKEAELRQHATCSLCKKPIGHMNPHLPLFWRVTVERFAVDGNAAQQQARLGEILGPAIVDVMGSVPDLALLTLGPQVLTVCEACACERRVPVAVLGMES